MGSSTTAGAPDSILAAQRNVDDRASRQFQTNDRCFHCCRALYGLQTIGARRVCGRSDCLQAALGAADVERAA